jgi:prepilin-type N-terminal cleavage/methylation domain-containing protein
MDTLIANNMKQGKGFSLVEVLVALAIVVASIGVFYRISADIVRTEKSLNIRANNVETVRNVLANVHPHEVLRNQKDGFDSGCSWKARCDAQRSFAVRDYEVCHLTVEVECGEKDMQTKFLSVAELHIAKKLPGGKFVWLD